jgi:hypothetical protein
MKSWEWKRNQQQTRSNQHIESRHLIIIQVRVTSQWHLLISSALTFVSDKATPDNKDAANKKFQEIAFAYAILSDERRRKRYDTTGNTSESLDLDDDDFNWTDFFREQYAAVVTAEALDRIKKDYQVRMKKARQWSWLRNWASKKSCLGPTRRARRARKAETTKLVWQH